MNPASLTAVIHSESLSLLTEAALAPRDQALRAWRDWRAAYDIDTTPWPDVRMLGAVAARIADLEPDASIRPRILGIRKFLWVQSQLCLRRAEGGLAALRRAGIPVLLMKGAARIALDPASAQERLIRDVDVLVPLDQQQRAFDALCGEGWALVPEAWQVNWHQWAPLAAHHAWSLAKEGAEIDLHHFSNHLNRLRGDDDGLWERSRELEWRGITLRVPSPADALVLALAHGVRWSADASADWAVDASALLDAGNVDWDVFLAEAEARQLHAVLLAGLSYLHDVLGKQVPENVLAALEASAVPEQRAELAQYADSANPQNEAELSISTIMAAQRVAAHARGGDPKPVDMGSAQRLGGFSLQLPVDKRMCTLDFSSPLDKAGLLGLAVRMTCADEPGNGPVICTIVAPGLRVGVLVGGPANAPPGSLPAPTLILPERLLGLREIRSLRLYFENYQGDLSVDILILRYG